MKKMFVLGIVCCVLASVFVFAAAPVLNIPSLAEQTPSAACGESNLTATATATDADGDSLTFIYNWLIVPDGTNTVEELMVLNTPFEGSGITSATARDYTNHSNDIDVYGPAWRSDDGVDDFGVYEFNGTNDRLWVERTDSLDFGTKDFSVEFWFKTSHATKRQTILSQGYSSNRWYVDLNPSAADDLGVIFCQDQGTTAPGTPKCVQASYSFSGNWDTDQWYHVTVSFDRDDVMDLYIGIGTFNTVYVQDSVDISAFDDNPPNGVFADDTYAVNIGAYLSSVDPTTGEGSYSQHFEGLIDQVKIWDRALDDGGVVRANQPNAHARLTENSMAHEELVCDDKWAVEVIANDGSEDSDRIGTNAVLLA